ncbi:MAG: hypothetical protein ACKVKR_03215 [Pseudomonadales bacterium]
MIIITAVVINFTLYGIYGYATINLQEQAEIDLYAQVIAAQFDGLLAQLASRGYEIIEP